MPEQPLHDDDLAAEIALLAEVILGAGSVGSGLTQTEVDRLLGV